VRFVLRPREGAQRGKANGDHHGHAGGGHGCAAPRLPAERRVEMLQCFAAMHNEHRHAAPAQAKAELVIRVEDRGGHQRDEDAAEHTAGRDR
jgi:hypothetical protein